MTQTDILAFIIQLLGSYIFVSIATSNAQKQTVLDQKQDLRTTKEDIMSELKDSRSTLLRQNDTLHKAMTEIMKQTVKAEVEQATKEQKK
ncbi:MAG: hypothetical protein IKT98_03815 [Selenomonadaceae bacterium]|nr:hypothetical protein [Selenomonadaceae bacterium]